MVLNYPGPCELEILYTVDGLEHKQRLNFDPGVSLDVGTAFADIPVKRRDAADSDLETETDAWVTILQPLFNSGVATIDVATCYQYTPDSFEKTWISEYTIGLPGTSAVAFIAAQQATFTFRTYEGGLMRLVLMELVGSGNACVGYAPLSASEKAMVDAALAATAPWLARDTSYPAAFVKACGGQNEACFRARYR